jgi:flagellar biosynthesis protein FlhG
MTIKQPSTMRVTAITGGKGGVGKTTLSVNMALSLAKMKKKVLLFDGDLGLANVDVLLGLAPTRNISDFIEGRCGLNEICVTGPYGLRIIPASSGLQSMVELDSRAIHELIHNFSELEPVDIMLIDTAAGISNQVMSITQAAQDILVVICNDPTSFVDSYAVIKILNRKYGRTNFGIVVNKAQSSQEAYEIFLRFQETIAQFINISIHFLGNVPFDDYIQLAARARLPLYEICPQAPIVKSFNQVAYAINQWHEQNQSLISGGVHFFFDQMISN